MYTNTINLRARALLQRAVLSLLVEIGQAIYRKAVLGRKREYLKATMLASLKIWFAENVRLIFLNFPHLECGRIHSEDDFLCSVNASHGERWTRTEMANTEIGVPGGC